MVAPLIAAAAQTGGRIAAKKVVPKAINRQAISRSTAAQSQAINNARAVKTQNLARRELGNTVGKPLPPAALRTPNAPQDPSSLTPRTSSPLRPGQGSLPNMNSRNTPSGSPQRPAGQGRRMPGPLLRSALRPSPTSAANDNERERGAGGRETERMSEVEREEAEQREQEEMLRQAQERVERIRQKTRTYGLASMEEGFKNKIEALKESRAKILQYAPALPFAILKDVLDIPGIASLPGLGTVIGIACSFAIFMILFFGRVNKKLIDSRFILRMAVVLICGTLIEFLPGINFLPIETITVLLIYVMDKSLTDKQIETITNVTKAIATRR